MKGYRKTVTMLWTPKDVHPKFVFQEIEQGKSIPPLHIIDMTSEWPKVRSIRFHLLPEEEAPPLTMDDHPDTPDTPQHEEGKPPHTHTPGNLSPIPEGSAEGEDEDHDDRGCLIVCENGVQYGLHVRIIMLVKESQ